MLNSINYEHLLSFLIFFFKIKFFLWNQELISLILTKETIACGILGPFLW